ncbi:MAG: pyridoxamine 5'-phosphate oxidase family protein [Candidatus Hydrothermarchaeales archaeon]
MEKRMIPKELEEMFSTIKTPIIFATADKKPHATPMNWFYLGNNTIWVSPVGGSSKIKNILKNKNVCLATVEGMRKGARGFVAWGGIIKMETGFIALLKNFRTLKKALKLRSKMSLKDSRTMKVTRMLHIHPDIYYNFAMPWKRYFLKIEIKRAEYWLKDREKKEIQL